MTTLVFRSTAGFKKYEMLFDKESIRHPAKMNLGLLSWLIDHYSEKGDWVVDPMAGTFSTCLIGALKGRNCVGVELEQKFVDMGVKNKVKLDRLQIQGKGECHIIQGDSRNLCEVLGKAGVFDTIITSPTYASTLYDLKGKPKEFWETLAKNTGRQAWVNENSVTRQTQKAKDEGYGDSVDNVGNLRYGKVDTIVCSPPYSESLNESKNTTSNLRREERLKTAGHQPKEFMGGEARNCQIEDGLCYSKSSLNIGNLPHGKIDAVITSPPYEESLEGGSRHYQKNGGHFKIIDDKQLPTAYSFKNEQQIGNLKGETYLEAMHRIYAECHAILKPNGIMVLVTKNFIRKKALVRLDLDTIKLCTSVGFTLKERHEFTLPQQSFWRINYQKKYPDAPRIEHEDILVFQKANRND